MFGYTHPAQQQFDLRSYLVTTGLSGIVLAAVIALAAISTSITGTSPSVGTAAAPAPLGAPVVRDLGSRDVEPTSGGLEIGAVRDLGSRDLTTTPFHPGGFGPGASQGTNSAGIGGAAAPAGFQPGFLAEADQRRINSGTSPTVVPAGGHMAPRAQ